MQVSSLAKWKDSCDYGKFPVVMAARHPHDKEEIGCRLRITREANVSYSTQPFAALHIFVVSRFPVFFSCLTTGKL